MNIESAGKGQNNFNDNHTEVRHLGVHLPFFFCLICFGMSLHSRLFLEMESLSK
jgi:hypothetical protein